MKGGNYEDKNLGPLFPRLHVNDADKGGPRAPPRNKMALYEQFTIPSHRLHSTASLTPHNAGKMVASRSSSQGCDRDRSILSPSIVHSHINAHSEKLNGQSSNGVSSDATRPELATRSGKHINKKLHVTESAAECSSPLIKETNSNNSYRKKLGDEEDFRVPTFVHADIPTKCDKDVVMGQEKLRSSCAESAQKSCSMINSSERCQESCERHLEGNNISDGKSRNSHINRSEKEPSEILAIKEAKEKSLLSSKSGEKSKERSPITQDYCCKEKTITKGASEKSWNGTSEKSWNGSLSMYEESCANGGLYEDRDNTNVVENQTVGRMRNGICSEASVINGHKTSKFSNSVYQKDDNKENGILELRDVEGKDKLCQSSLVDSVLGFEISPDDVVAVIGPKHFWKARRAIVNQQRVFALQVFELHRLIKVQKLIAASPDLLFQGNPYLEKFPASTENPPSEFNGKSQSQTAEDEDDTQKSKQRTDCSKENTEASQPLPSHESGVNGSRHGYFPPNGPYTGNSRVEPMAPESRPNSWCLPPPMNQWLVPVMSPSEGLVYKPYTGPCPPAGSLITPFYANCPPLNLPSAAGDFMNSAYGVPPPHQPHNIGVPPVAPAVAPSYFSSYGVPVVNSVISSSAVEQVTQLAASRPNGQAEQNSQMSCNMSHPKSDPFSRRGRRFQASKDSELQGSSASIPLDMAQREGADALSLFPKTTATDGPPQHSPDSQDNQTRVIKVVPHNARSATESAARIFRSIQKERQQNDS
ncbi:protein HEADING DATE 3B [Typha latifolia]|uniref:protein HEADING DATE 3B n=1 Tax=Typha latifolia TaxID=4733 RepID=UPI003C2EEEE8